MKSISKYFVNFGEHFPDDYVIERPELVMFDYGHTLSREDPYDRIKGLNALLDCLPDRMNLPMTDEEIYKLADEFFLKIWDVGNKYRLESYFQHFLQMLWGMLGQKPDIDLVEQELTFWWNTSHARPMEGVNELLAHLKGEGYRTAVLSNIAHSEAALRRRIVAIIPEHEFEFVLATSEVIVRKPSQRIFDIALRMADLPPSALWYCGDNAIADVQGAHGAGIRPVWYRSLHECDYHRDEDKTPPDLPYIQITEWQELGEILAALPLRVADLK
ncbi:MAG: HAD family hydrolase [Clostridiaceae bacterium]|nr:HAD family hydrolase [Clostridiaceae bacterium]